MPALIRALESSDLEGVAQRARALVEREFTFERAVEEDTGGDMR